MAAAMPLRDTPLTAQISVCSEISKAKTGAKIYLQRQFQIPPAPPYANLKAARDNHLVAFYLCERHCDWAFLGIALQARFAQSGSFASFDKPIFSRSSVGLED